MQDQYEDFSLNKLHLSVHQRTLIIYASFESRQNFRLSINCFTALKLSKT